MATVRDSTFRHSPDPAGSMENSLIALLKSLQEQADAVKRMAAISGQATSLVVATYDNAHIVIRIVHCGHPPHYCGQVQQQYGGHMSAECTSGPT